MYKKLARIGPISCGMFFALMLLLFYLLLIGLGFAASNTEFINTISAPYLMILATAGVQLPISDPQQINMVGIAYGAGMTLIVGFVFGLITAILYNIIAMITGGIKVKTYDLGYDDI